MIQRCIPGSISEAAGIVARLDPRTVLVFAGGASYASSGASTAIDRAVAGRSVRMIRDVPADPTVDDVNRSITVFRADPPDLVIAVGGGSVIDLAKAVRTIGPVSPDARPYLLGDRTVEGGGPPLLAVPTTAGTGSEATRYAVFTVDREKRPVGHPALTPELVILDPELTYSLPPAVTASTGLDALAQAMESMWSTRSTDVSYADARKALHLAWTHLPAAVHDPVPGSRTAMCTAAYLSGRAIDISATTAPHALSFHLTTDYGVPHGHAVALTLGPILEFNADVSERDCSDPRGPDHVRRVIADVLDVLDVGSSREANTAITNLVGSLGLDPTLSGVGVTGPSRRRSLADSASPMRLATNPRQLDREELRRLVDGIA